MWPLKWLLVLLLFSSSNSVQAFLFGYNIPSTANLSSTWTNDQNFRPYIQNFRPIISTGSGPNENYDLRFSCGFICSGTCDSFLFAIFSEGIILGPVGSVNPHIVWSANRDNPISENGTLQLTQDGDLVLRDVDGTMVWSTNTSAMFVVGMRIMETGNLVLFDMNNKTIWQSFDHPTDTLLLGQKLVAGQRLTASNWTRGQYNFSVGADGFEAFVEADPPQVYYKFVQNGYSITRFVNGSLAVFTANESRKIDVLLVPETSSVQYMRLELDGHLRVYEWIVNNRVAGWQVVSDLMNRALSDCDYPKVCGNYGICSNDQCSCPKGIDGGAYFTQIDERKPNIGCYRITELSCHTPQNHHLVELERISYFNTYNATILTEMDVQSCKGACLNNCSCKAAVFGAFGHHNGVTGFCFLQDQLFSLKDIQNEVTRFNSSVFIKVQIPPIPIAPSSTPPGKKTRQTAIVLSSTLGASIGLILIISICIVSLKGNKKIAGEEEDNAYFDQVQGMPMRFSYLYLKAATENFCRKLGQGGFGSVFEGTLDDGTKVAVKCLDGIGQVQKEFLSEVEIIGNIHHVNLVRLIGFCATKSCGLLVLEYMSHGSLDKWIFYRNQNPALDWQTRRKIILHIAKGLSYLHDECRQRILHLDIKPQNILLDSDFNAKVSDFGLSKWIDKDQSLVMTRMKGTPGYLAPEWWLGLKITEKVDVYSFGVVVIEIMCGRKNLDLTQPEESIHLLSLLMRKAEEDRLLDIVDNGSEDMHIRGREAVEMIRLAIWCLQGDCSRRPSMASVVKVLEGVMDVELGLDYNFLTPPPVAAMAHREVHLGSSGTILASILSGPR
ncbi:G-type lectin S-receptor-like serine/threonine-protein kinase SD2-5 [Tasmannia lanceolata]|uniref:G-type lectin S-receptor-like serine/threonine-protein kinase SD2-5 n=1 Tax=Tasmannia lanceolata TaxID=3420 RepID=UPI0040640E2E